MSWPVTINGTTYTQNDFFGPNGFEYVDNWPLLIQDMLAVANNAQTSEGAAQQAVVEAEAARDQAINAITNLETTSSTTVTITNSGTVTFTTDDNLDSTVPIPNSRYVKCVANDDPTLFIIGSVDSGAGNTLVITALKANGSGTFSSWDIFPTGQPGEDAVPSVTAAPFETINPEDTILFSDASNNDNGRRGTLQEFMIQSSIMMENF